MRVEVGGRFRDSTYIGSNAPVDFAIRPYIPLSSNRSVECWTTTSPEANPGPGRATQSGDTRTSTLLVIRE